jgi:uncharacterized protein with NRDE domain
MCIAIISTAHPDYAFILLSNRDEVIARPTLRADWWDPPLDHVLGGRDLQRSERGTWLGITKQGRVAVLTNFREPDVEVAKDKSRGGIVNAYLKTPPGVREESEAEFVERLAREVGVHDVGGFTLAFGRLRAAKRSRRSRMTTMQSIDASSSASQTSTTHIASSMSEQSRIPPLADLLDHTPSYPGLSLVSNRTPIPSASESFQLPRILTTTHETHALSNSTFEDKTWPKTIHGTHLLQQALHDHTTRARGDESALLASLFDILSIDALPQRQQDESWETHGRRMRGSIFIGAEKGELSASPNGNHHGSRDQGQNLSKTAYGTMKQTVILVDHDGRVKFVERTLWDAEGRRVPEAEVEKRFEFGIEGWWEGQEEADGDDMLGVRDDVEKGEYDSPLLIVDAVQDEAANVALDLGEAEDVSIEQARGMADAEVAMGEGLENRARICGASDDSGDGNSMDDVEAERNGLIQSMDGSIAFSHPMSKAKL